ncbi:MAG: hypothetical protein HQK49_09620 [Oligoflexia bacterium]|nr:hypothetical protein [Oligoflexia bacterium]
MNLDTWRLKINESCSHHTMGDNITQVMLPKWINEFTKKRYFQKITLYI